jgi:hypothetical protein
MITEVLSGEMKMEPNRPVPLSTSEAARQGRALVADLLSRKLEPTAESGILKTRDGNRKEQQIPVRIDVSSTTSNVVTRYEANPVGQPSVKLTIIHNGEQPNEYILIESAPDGLNKERHFSGADTMVPFAGSEFWIADLGLEFLHWPKQLLLRKEMRRSQFCSVLESTNPHPAAGYSRVVSWIEADSGAIVHADAYDVNGQLLKLFDPTELQKIQGQHQVKEIEMRNRKTGARSWIEFNLEPH